MMGKIDDAASLGRLFGQSVGQFRQCLCPPNADGHRNSGPLIGVPAQAAAPRCQVWHAEIVQIEEAFIDAVDLVARGI